MSLYSQAVEFAARAHKDQKRKYSDDPYIVHPIAVAHIVSTVTDDQQMIAAAVLHDVVEDCGIPLATIIHVFGERIGMLVGDLTDVSKPSDGTREKRKAIDRAHTATAHPDSKTIKLADLIHNTKDITRSDPGFARIYMAEKRLLLPWLKEGNAVLWERAKSHLDSYDVEILTERNKDLSNQLEEAESHIKHLKKKEYRDTQIVDYLGKFWDSQHTSEQYLLGGKAIANVNGSFRGAMLKEMNLLHEPRS